MIKQDLHIKSAKCTALDLVKVSALYNLVQGAMAVPQEGVYI